MAENNTNDWKEWRRHILLELERQGKSIEDIKVDLSKIKTDLAMLKVKAGSWGAIAGGVLSIGVILATKVI